MKLFTDLLPIILFFASYRIYGVYVATSVLMIATIVQMGFIYIRERRLQIMQQLTLFLVIIFGALTLLLHNENYIKWKPSVLYLIFALSLALSDWIFDKNILKIALGSQINLPSLIWFRVNLLWIGYTLFMSFINGYIALFYSTSAWFNFKIWGYIFPILFIIVQVIYISRHTQLKSQPKVNQNSLKNHSIIEND